MCPVSVWVRVQCSTCSVQCAGQQLMVVNTALISFHLFLSLILLLQLMFVPFSYVLISPPVRPVYQQSGRYNKKKKIFKLTTENLVLIVAM